MKSVLVTQGEINKILDSLVALSSANQLSKWLQYFREQTALPLDFGSLQAAINVLGVLDMKRNAHC